MSFAPVTITAPNTRAVVRLGAAGGSRRSTRLPRDNVFNFVLTPDGAGAGDGGVAGIGGRDLVSVARAGDRRGAALRRLDAVARRARRRCDEPRARDHPERRADRRCGRRQARDVRRRRRRLADGARPARVVAGVARGVAAGVDRAAGRSHARRGGASERHGLRPRDLRAVPRAAQRRFFDRAVLFVSRARRREGRQRAGALRYRRARARRTRGGPRPRHRVSRRRSI